MEGVVIHTVWTVDEGIPLEAAKDYKAKIELILPKKADAEELSRSENETVVIRHKGGLKCSSAGVEAKAKYRVTPVDDASGQRVLVTVTADIKHHGKTETVVLGRVSGKIGKNLKLEVLIPTVGKKC